MKRYNILFSIILLLLCSSCRKDDNSAFEQIVDSVIGTYRLVYATIQSDGVDINNDGISGNDVFLEFADSKEEAFSNSRIAFEHYIYISKIIRRNWRQHVDFFVPLQGLEWNIIEEKYLRSYYGKLKSLAFEVLINNQNEIEAYIKETEDDDGFNSSNYLDDNRCNIESVEMKGDGHINIFVHHTFFDYATNQLVERSVLYRYKRISYSM